MLPTCFSVSFPFLVLLASGGHCILAIAEDVDKFYRLGETKDIAPGEAFDKVNFIVKHDDFQRRSNQYA